MPRDDAINTIPVAHVQCIRAKRRQSDPRVICGQSRSVHDLETSSCRRLRRLKVNAELERASCLAQSGEMSRQLNELRSRELYGGTGGRLDHALKVGIEPCKNAFAGALEHASELRRQWAEALLRLPHDSKLFSRLIKVKSGRIVRLLGDERRPRETVVVLRDGTSYCGLDVPVAKANDVAHILF